MQNEPDNAEAHPLPRVSPRINAEQFVQTPFHEKFKAEVGSWLAQSHTKIAKLDAKLDARWTTAPSWLCREKDRIARECLSRIQDKAVVVAAQAYASPADVFLSVTKYHGRYIRRNVDENVMRFLRVGDKCTENHFLSSFHSENIAQPRCFPRQGDLVSVMCCGSEDCAMVLSEGGEYHTVSVREAAALAGGWHKITHLRDVGHATILSQADLDSLSSSQPSPFTLDPRCLSGVALLGQMVYYTDQGKCGSRAVMQRGRVTSIHRPGSYQVTWLAENGSDVSLTFLSYIFRLFSAVLRYFSVCMPSWSRAFGAQEVFLPTEFSLDDVRRLLVYPGEVEVVQELGMVLSGNMQPIHPNHLVKYYSFDPIPIYPVHNPFLCTELPAGATLCQFDRVRSVFDSHTAERKRSWKKNKRTKQHFSPYEVQSRARMDVPVNSRGSQHNSLHSL